MNEPMARGETPPARELYLLVDTSRSMTGHRIGAVNEALDNLLRKLRDAQRTREGVEYRVALLEFGEKPFWWASKPAPVQDFSFRTIERVEGYSGLGAGYTALAKALRERIVPEPPVLLLCSDGLPTDEYAPALAALRELPAFREARRIALALEEDLRDPLSMRTLSEFASGFDCLLRMGETERLMQLLLGGNEAR